MASDAATSEPPADGDDELPPKGEIFDVLRNQRRRFVLEYLKRNEGPVELGDLASQVAAWEYDTTVDDVTSDQRKRVYTTLQQTHLSKMDEVGIIRYDSADGIIESTRKTADLTVYLEIVPGREFPWREYYLSLGAVSCAIVAVLWGGVWPFTLIPPLVWATIIAVSVTLSAGLHIYRERDMQVGSGDQPPEVEAGD